MTTAFQMTITQIIQKALRRLGVWAEGETMTSEMFNSAFEDLGLIMKGLRRYGKLLPVLEQERILVSPPDSVIHNDQAYYALTSHTSSADNEPGVAEGWQNYWYPSDFFSDDASAWALDTEYSSGNEITIDNDIANIEYAFIRDDDADYPLQIIDRFREAAIVSKWETSRPRFIRLDRTASQVRLFYLADEEYYVTFGAVRQSLDITSQVQVPEVPVEWYDFLIYALAAKQAEEYEIDHIKIGRLKAEASRELQLNLRDQEEDRDTGCIRPAYDN